MGPSDTPMGEVFVGRVDEVDELGSALASARAGTGRAVLITGDAGVGKTRLAQHAASLAGDVDVLTGTCLPLSTLTVPLLPLRMVVGGSLGQEPAEAFDEWLARRCAERPVALVIDDLQWADQTTLDVLMWVVAGLSARRLVLLMTLRRGEVGPGHPLARWLSDVRRLPGFGEVSLDPLDLGETREQVAGLVGGVPHESLVHEVFDRTAGNAYLNRLLVRGLPASATTLGEQGLPEDLAAAVLRRWHALSAPARDLTRAAAVGSRVLRGRALAHAAVLAGVDDPTPLLRECIDAELLDPQPLDGYWFHHPLQAEALEAGLPEPERRRLHAAFAALLEADLDGAPPDLSTAILVADHHERAGNTAPAFAWALVAAGVAEAEQADAEATRLLERAIAAHATMETTDVPVTELLLRLRAAAGRAGALEPELRAVDALLDSGLGPLPTSELIVSRQHLRFATGLGFIDATDLRLAVDLASADPTSWQAALATAELAHALFWDADPSAPGLAAKAAELARASGHPRALAYALSAIAMDTVFAERPEQGVLPAREAVAAAAESRDGWAFVHASLWEANCSHAPFSEECATLLRRRRLELVELGLPQTSSAWLAADEAHARLPTGQWEAASALLREVLGSAPGALAVVIGRLTAAQLAARQGRADEAMGHLARADELFVDTSTFVTQPFDATRAFACVAAGDARGCVQAALAGVTRGAVTVTMAEWLLPLAARGLADLTQEARDLGRDAGALVTELNALALRHPHTLADAPEVGSHKLVLAALDALYQAELARGLVSADRVDRWNTAVGLLGSAGLAWEECYASWRSAEALFATGSAGRPEAIRALRHAHQLATQLGAQPDLEQVSAIARSARVLVVEPDPDLPPSVTAPGPSDGSGTHLSRRELEVLAHVAAGRTYGEIARALVLSEKTVSSHVSHLLAKTGTTNRVDLARWASRRRPKEGDDV